MAAPEGSSTTPEIEWVDSPTGLEDWLAWANVGDDMLRLTTAIENRKQ